MDRYIGLDGHASSCALAAAGPSGPSGSGTITTTGEHAIRAQNGHPKVRSGRLLVQEVRDGSDRLRLPRRQR